MIRLIGVEFAKFFATRTWMWTGALFAAAAFGMTAVVGIAGPTGNPPLPGPETEDGLAVAIGMPGMLVIIPALVGLTAMTGEYRHGTAVPTFLAVPRRWRVVAAKLAAFTAIGAGYGAVAAAAGGAGIALACAVLDVQAAAGTAAIATGLARGALAITAYTLIGVGFGALVRNQLAGLAVLGGYLYFIDPLLSFFPVLGPLQPFLPRGATDALTGFGALAERVAAESGIPAPDLLAPGPAALVLLGYALLAAAVAVALPVRRDVV
ncbi:ABC transporter permease [Nocardiopsis sp. CNT-189]|uniref:ABC transporter permease n=1 Tax=Nocardiopsis oceanisediminis TaxID=2816862 RepID=UPI003B2EC0EF